MNNKDLQDNAQDEILSVGDVKIQQMIKNLPRVNAPKDFDFRLKARIANAKPTEFQPRFFPVLRYVLPLSVVVLIFTFVIINGVYFGGSNSQTAQTFQPISVERKIAPTNDSQIAPPQAAKVPVEPALNTDLADSVPPKVEAKKKELSPAEETKFVAVKLPKKPQAELPQVKDDDDDSGSRTTSLDVKPVIINPSGIFPSELVESSPNNDNKNDILTKQILLPRGIEIVSENGNRRVKSVKKNSIAERSNVKVGDLIEAIDGEKVSGDAVRGKKLEGKKITVLRGAEKIEIDFNNQ
ncbi:hypothetical protein BH20ACI1_BH20ACI1_16160 [soil metagenome]